MTFEYSEEYKKRCQEVRKELTHSIAKQLGIPYEEYVKDMNLTVSEFKQKYKLDKIELEIAFAPTPESDQLITDN